MSDRGVVVLGDHSNQAATNAWGVGNQGAGEDNQLASANHGSHVAMEDGMVVMSRFVGTIGGSLMEVGWDPRGGGKDDGDAPM